MAFITAASMRLEISRHRPLCTKRAARAAPVMIAEPGPITPNAQIVIGSVALAIPFFVAAVLFGERIYRQRKCAKCKGSGLVPMGRYMKRCPKYFPPAHSLPPSSKTSAPNMDTPIPDPLLIIRARSAILTRQDLLLTSLLSALQHLRQTLQSEPCPDTRHASLSAVLRLSQLTTQALDLSLLPLPPLPKPKSPQQPKPIRKTSPTENLPQKSFQKRTFYRSKPIDERRAPVADWNITRASSLCVTFSGSSLDTLDSLRSGGNPRNQRVYGYSGYRVDDGYAPFPVDDLPHQVHPVRTPATVKETPQFVVPPVEQVSIVRLRDSVFEIGVDGRIRRQTTPDTLNLHHAC